VRSPESAGHKRLVREKSLDSFRKRGNVGRVPTSDVLRIRRFTMNIDITPNAEQLLAKRGGVMTIDFISAVG
jgi:hypothetical protein